MNARSLLIISNLVTIAVTAVGVLFALNSQHQSTAASVLPFSPEEESPFGAERKLQDCCSCTTGSPTSAPVPGGGGFVVCFTGDSTVNVRGNANTGSPTLMKDLKIGDFIHVGNGKYERVYSFGHNSPSTYSDDFVQISMEGKDTKLTLSPDHMVWSISGGNTFIAASEVKVGDELLWDGMDVVRVQAIETDVTAQGLFAPFTPSGTIVVDGILASSFIDSVKHLGIAGVSPQWIAHSFEFPHRLFCHYSIFGSTQACTNESYNDQGISSWVAKPFQFGQWVLNNENVMIKYSLLTMFFLVLGVFNVIEAAFFQYPIMGIAGLLGWYFSVNRRSANKL